MVYRSYKVSKDDYFKNVAKNVARAMQHIWNLEDAPGERPPRAIHFYKALLTSNIWLADSMPVACTVYKLFSFKVIIIETY